MEQFGASLEPNGTKWNSFASFGTPDFVGLSCCTLQGKTLSAEMNMRETESGLKQPQQPPASGLEPIWASLTSSQNVEAEFETGVPLDYLITLSLSFLALDYLITLSLSFLALDYLITLSLSFLALDYLITLSLSFLALDYFITLSLRFI